MSLIKRSLEIIKNQGIKQLAESIKKYLWWHPILDELRWYTSQILRPKYQIIKVGQQHNMLVDISLGGIHKELYLHGHHELESTRVFSEIIPQNAVVVDIGANIGYYALIEAPKAYKVFAIEPESQNIKLLRKNIALNSYEDIVEVHQLAVSDTTGKALLALSEIPNRHRLKSLSNMQFKKVIEVKTITLDDFLEGKDVDIIRMDVEGAEWLIINGMKNLLSKGKPLKMFIEVHSKLIVDYGGDAQLMLDSLFEAGFKVSHLVVATFTRPAYSLKSFLKFEGTQREQVFKFNLPADKHEFNTRLGHIISNYDGYRLFFVRN